MKRVFYYALIIVNGAILVPAFINLVIAVLSGAVKFEI